MRLVSIPIVQTQPSFLFRFGLCFPFALTAFWVDAFPGILPAFWVDAFPCILPAFWVDAFPGILPAFWVDAFPCILPAFWVDAFPCILPAFWVDAFPCILPAFWVDAFPCILPAPRVELEAKIPLIDRVMPSRSFQTTVPKHVLEVWRKTIGRRNQINYCHIIELKSIRG